jgi:hypothetical protein
MLASLQCNEYSIVLVHVYIKYTDLLSSIKEIAYLIFILVVHKIYYFKERVSSLIKLWI